LVDAYALVVDSEPSISICGGSRLRLCPPATKTPVAAADLHGSIFHQYIELYIHPRNTILGTSTVASVLPWYSPGIAIEAIIITHANTEKMIMMIMMICA